jgi:diguanylate cyclase (GGDEF)-like protein/putative nucleotidyltransferase with HDIG domain
MFEDISMKILPLKAKLYLFSTYLIGFAIFTWHTTRITVSHPWLFLVLCVLASLALVFKVIGATNNSHYTFSFLVYGFAFAIFGLPPTLIVILVSNLVEWVWNNSKWYGQLFNICSYFLAMWVASLVYFWINPTRSVDTWQAVLAVFASMVIFNLLNHLAVGIVVWLARGENFKKSGIFDFFPLILDLTLLLFGASLSFVWNYNSYAIVLFTIPIYLIYSTLRVPALERKTEIDHKTGLFNHDYFKKHLSNELARANRFDRPLSVILADLDLLRNINNTYGHLAGDEVLIGIAQAMKNAVRDYDVVCRFGGEEFAVLLPETTMAQAFERAEIIRNTVKDLEFTIPTSIKPIRVTLSLGVAQRENFSQSQEEITHNADLALYHSKLSGRNKTFAFSNDTYLDFLDNTKEPVRIHPQPTADSVSMGSSISSAEETPNRPPEMIKNTVATPIQTTTAQQAKPDVEAKPSVGSKNAVTIFIGVLALLALLSLVTLTFSISSTVTFHASDWIGMLVIAGLISLSEIFSIDLYAKQSSISTSAIPILVAYLLFGTIGVILASVVLAISLLIKYRSPLNRFIFNLSNHMLSGVLVVSLVVLTGDSLLNLPVAYQIGISLLAAGILYLVTTLMVAIGMGLDLKQPIRQLWQEQFSWLAPYYVGIGLITYALIFGYEHDHITGLLLMVIPMLLLRISQKQYIDRTREVVTELREKNQILKKNSEEISDLNEGLLITLSDIIDLRDPYVLGHSKQVSKYATSIAQQIGLNEKQTDLIRKAGLLHDIGKLGIPMEILTKPGKLTKSEYETIIGHASLGGDLVKNSPSLRPLSHIIRHHHERYDGNGYPDKMTGNQISIEARIIAVADAIEAMISDRPYRRALKFEKVKEELLTHSGTQFDPLVVDAAIKVLDKMHANSILQSFPTDAFSDITPKFTTDSQAP